MIFRAIFGSPVGKQIILLVAILVAAILFNTYGQIVLNRWNKPFYDALSRRDLNDFLYQLGVWAGIVSTLLVLDVVQRWLTETTKYRLREGLTRDLLALWMVPRRAFWLATSGGPMGVNPDQRMSEDAHKLCDLSTDLSVGLFRASVLLVGFAGVLWSISNDFEIRISSIDYRVPGFMLWAAISYALVGSLLSYVVGRSLIRRNADRYSREADLRFSLVRINEHVDGIALAEGEADERRRVEQHLGNVMTALKRLIARPHQSHLGDGRVRLDHRHRADPRRRAAVLQRQDHLRRHDDGCGRVHAGAGLAALVRGQLQRHRGLARHAPARGEFPPGARRHRHEARLQEPHHLRGRPAGHR